MRSYLNGSGMGTPPLAPGHGPGGRPVSGHRGGMMTGRTSSSSLPRSPDNDMSLLTSGLGTGSGSGQSGHGSLGSHSSHEVSYTNIYQNTNQAHHIYVSTSTVPLVKHNFHGNCFSGQQFGEFSPSLLGI